MTPSLWHFTPLKSGRFISGRKFLVRDADHKSWIREVSLDERPIDDLKTLCRFLSGGALPSEQAAFLNGRQLMELWKQLQAKHPAQFAVSEQEIVAWHEYQLEHCVREQDWFAAAFHLKHLHRLKPGDTSFAERLRVAQGKSQRK